MIFANSETQAIHHLLEQRRHDAARAHLLRDRPPRPATARLVLASMLRRVADAVEPRAVHRHHPHLPS